ncbi:MAG: TIM barrel protein [Negativicutes bacterium]|jgi:sugar phosphate isomerase/epimerase
MNNFGMPTLIELKTLQQQVDLCKQLGLDFVELNMNLPEYSVANLAKIDYRNFAEQGVRFNIHAPEELDLAAFHDDIRNGFVKLVVNTLTAVPAGMIDIFNIHLNNGVHFKLPDKKIWLYDEYCDDFLRNLRQSIEVVLPVACEKQIKICVENTGNFSMAHIRKALELLLEYDDIFLTWDVGHDYSAGYPDTVIFEQHLDKIRHFHLHDAIGEKCHLEFFEGDIDLQKFLVLSAKLNCSAVIETKSVQALVNSVAKLATR